jgi:hypothetical protein
MLVSANQAIHDACVHQLSCALQAFDMQIRSIDQQVSDPFIVYRIGPLRTKKVCSRKFDQQVPQWCGIKDACVVDDGKAGQDQ